jgi:hypothetical protein
MKKDILYDLEQLILIPCFYHSRERFFQQVKKQVGHDVYAFLWKNPYAPIHTNVFEELKNLESCQ